ncbi:hypothetical protein [Microlunatus endophyticus]|uniref:hypothetical protein n=1 Tax=Microlunatus endophyticus TaxID=1716077 RepID=UPI001662B206|nr:hypothetical protein [Microlunatus endophyticus]
MRAGVRPRRALTVRTILIIVALAVIFAILRLLSGLPTPASDSGFYTTKLVLVGVTGRTTPDATDRRVIDAHRDDAQIGAISIRPQEQQECAAAGWLTIGAGRRTTAGGLCDPTVTGSGTTARVTDWSQRLDIAARNAGDAKLGTLASTSPGCVEAVGPGAALAAANPDGTLDRYETATDLIGSKERLDCPLTIVDAGSESDKIISALAARSDVTLIVSGVGPNAGSRNRDLQAIYRIGTTLPGMMTSDSTRRRGIVILTDLSRTLIGFSLGDKPVPAGAPIDGSPIEVQTDRTPSAALLAGHLRSIHNLSAVAPAGYLAGTIVGVLLAAVLAVALLRRWWRTAWAMIAGLGTLTATLMLTGSFPWQASSHPGVALVITLVLWTAILIGLTLLISRWRRLPVPMVAAGLVMAAFTTDAALGGLMEPGSLLNSKPVIGGRWYGFGNVSFGCYAASILSVAGYVAHRYLRHGHRTAAMIGVLTVGALGVLVEGWPSMGSDFGGVITLVPAILLMAIAISGRRITWGKIIGIVAAAVIVVAGVSLLDWSRGAGHRTHLGDFVQRVIAGDAWPILIRKAEASLHTMILPGGIAGIIVAAAIWVIILRWLRKAVPEDLYAPFTITAIAACLTSVLGTLDNDGGVWVLVTVTGPFALTTFALLMYRYQAYGLGAVLRWEEFADRPTPGVEHPVADHRDPHRSGNPAIRGRTRRRR